MQFSCLQENLNTALSHVSRFVSLKNQLPILGNILFTTQQGRLCLSATNLEIGIKYFLGAKITKPGSITIPVKEITEFVSYLSPGRLDFSLDSKQLLHLSTPKIQSTFTTAPAKDFPSLPSLDSKNTLTLDLSLLTQAISQIAFSASTDDSRPVLTAILCRFTSTHLLLVATDGFRLSCKNIKLSQPLDLKSKQQSLTLLIPARSLVEITKLAKNESTITFGLSPDGNQLVFVLEDLELSSRLIEGDFPDYQRIIPQSYLTKLTVNHQELSQAIRMASVFARQSANIVRFIITQKGLSLTSNAPQIGQNQIDVEAQVQGEPLQIAFNYKFVSEFLDACPGDTVIIELNESLTPAFFHDQSQSDFTHIIMPVKLQD